MEILSSIFYNNFVTEKLVSGFNDYWETILKHPSFPAPIVFRKFSLGTSWLSGFIDGRCSINIRKDRFAPYVIILNNNSSVLLQIASLVETGSITKNNLLQISGWKGVQLLMNYLQKHPLRLNHESQQWLIKAIEIRGKTSITISSEHKSIMLQHILSKTHSK